MEYLNLIEDGKTAPPPNTGGRLNESGMFMKKAEIKTERALVNRKKLALEIVLVLWGVCFWIVFSGYVRRETEFKLKENLVAVFLLALWIVPTFVLFVVLIKKKDSFRTKTIEQTIRVNVFSSFKAVAPFREYYGYTEPNLVTKCFLSSDPKFSGRDVCLFIGADGTLRIAADLRHGFLRLKEDSGCYVFGKNEYACISRKKSEYNIVDEGSEKRCVLLKSESVYFVLGKRSYRFLSVLQDQNEKNVRNLTDK